MEKTSEINENNQIRIGRNADAIAKAFLDNLYYLQG